MSDEVVWGVPSFWIERFPLYFGKHKGFFSKRNISLKIEYFWGGPELARAVAQRKVLIGEMGLPPFLKALSEGLQAQVIGSSTIQQLNHYLVSRPEIKSLEDLKGKKVGILSFGSCDDYFLRFMLKASGVDADTEVNIVPLGEAYGDIGCFSPGRIDAGFLVEPYVALGESLGRVKILAVVKDYFPRYQWGIILAHNDLLEGNPGLVRRAMEAYRESCRAIKENPGEASAFGAQVFRLKKEIFSRALFRDLDSWELDAQIDREGMKNCVKIQKVTGAIPREFTPMEFCQ